MKDYDRWFVIQYIPYEGGHIKEFDRAGQAADFIKSEIDMSQAKLEDFQVIYGREFELKIAEEVVSKVKKVEFV